MTLISVQQERWKRPNANAATVVGECNGVDLWTQQQRDTRANAPLFTA